MIHNPPHQNAPLLTHGAFFYVNIIKYIMNDFLYYFFHQKAKIANVIVPKNKDLWPKSWKTVEYKKYTSYDSMSLKDVKNGVFFEFLKKRYSKRSSFHLNVINLENISYILKCAYGEIQHNLNNIEIHRTVPSGGSRYSLEIYLYIFNDTSELKSGIYHYNIKNHELEVVKYKVFSKDDIKSFNSYDFILDSGGFICISAVFDRSVRKYGNLGYKLILLEAGHVGQNILLAGVEKGIMFCPLGRCNDELLEKEISVSGFDESIVYVFAF